MPKVRTSRKRPPEGWDLISPTLDDLERQMREGICVDAVVFKVFVALVCLGSNHRHLTAAENEPHEGKRKAEALWPIFRIHHQRSRYIYELFYKRKAISRELYEYCLREGIADQNLIAKWKKVCTEPRLNAQESRSVLLCTGTHLDVVLALMSVCPNSRDTNELAAFDAFKPRTIRSTLSVFVEFPRTN
jgi:bud site selection protein 31